MSAVRKFVIGGLAVCLTAAGLLGFAPSASASTVVGVEYWDWHYQGATFTITVASNGFSCTGPTTDVDVTYNGFSGTSWDNQISSFRGYSNCWTKIWDLPGFGGASLPFQGDTDYVGDTMNDKTSSIQWS